MPTKSHLIKFSSKSFWASKKIWPPEGIGSEIRDIFSIISACIAPQASMRDGMLSVTVLKPFSVVEIPVILGQLFSSHLYNNERIETINARWVKIKRKKPGVVHFDGEPMMMSNELMVEIVPSGLNVLALPEWDGRGANISLFRQGFDMLRASVDSDIIPHLETLSHLHNIPEFFKRDTKE